MKQSKTNKSSPIALMAALCFMFNAQVFATDVQDFYSYQASKHFSETPFVQSNIEGLFQGTKMQKTISEQFSVEMIRLRSAHKEFDFNHQNILESNTSFSLIFAKEFSSKFQFGSTRQDISLFNQSLDDESNTQRMYAFTQGWKKDFGHSINIESYLGIVQSSDQRMSEEKYFPIFGMRLRKSFDNETEIQVHAAQEIQAGGSATGMYGNQVFRKMIVLGKIPLLKKLSFLWDAGIGFTEGSFKENNFSLDAGVATISTAVQYNFAENLKGSIGYSHRSLMAGTGTEGHMMSASFSFANF